jgi:monothiol glutaredoxin
MRRILNKAEMTPGAQEVVKNYHSTVIDEIIIALQTHEWVILGMAQNPVVKKARKLLEAKNIPYHYIEHGSYFSKWKLRLAIKLWSGWPTFPQVFHNGKLVGGASDLEKYLSSF